LILRAATSKQRKYEIAPQSDTEITEFGAIFFKNFSLRPQRLGGEPSEALSR
jgi:hypothetical protein